MSPTENDMNRQVRRHRGPLLGFVAIVAFVSIILVWWLYREIDEADNPRGADTQIDGRTGQPVEGTAPDPLQERPPPGADTAPQTAPQVPAAPGPAPVQD